MSPDLSSLESDLQRLRAAALDDSLLDRLEACTTGTWTTSTPAELAFEARLAKSTPAPLPPALLDNLQTLLAGVPFPHDPAILPFPQPAAAAPPRRRTHPWWRAAAVVAISGAATALLIPGPHSSSQVAVAPPAAPITRPTAAADLVPASFKRGLTEARDEGVVWQANRPHRVLKVVYTDHVTLKDAAGRTYQVDQPRVEYILVPAKTD